MYIEYSLIIHHSLSLTTDLFTVNLIALNTTQFCVLFLWYIEQSGALNMMCLLQTNFRRRHLRNRLMLTCYLS